MARKKQETVVLTDQQKIDRALEQGFFRDTHPDIIPPPSRTFEVGEQVWIGNQETLKEYVERVLMDGKAYLIRRICKKIHQYTREVVGETTEYTVVWWDQIQKIKDTTNVPQLFAKYDVARISKTTIESVMWKMGNGGLVCDPLYQRDYVWSEENKQALLDSVFERLELGTITTIHQQGYLHKDDSTVTYRTMDGRTVTVPRKSDYATVIVDGQQRLTTLYAFYTDRLAYRGVYFSQLNPRDQGEFLNTAIAERHFEESSVDQKTILRIFLQSNRGVPQAPEHIAKVQALYDSLK